MERFLDSLKILDFMHRSCASPQRGFFRFLESMRMTSLTVNFIIVFYDNRLFNYYSGQKWHCGDININVKCKFELFFNGTVFRNYRKFGILCDVGSFH